MTVCMCTKVYRERVLSVAVNCAKEAAKTKVKRFVHFSTAQVYDCDKVGTDCAHSLIALESVPCLPRA